MNICRVALLLAVMLAGSAALVMAAPPAGTQSVKPLAAPLCVALVVEKDYPDQGLVQALHQGLNRARQELGMQVSVMETPDSTLSLEAADAQEAAFRQAAATHDVVVVATPALHELLMNQAGNYRKTRFVCLGAEVKAEHIASVTFADTEASFLAGAAAALLLEPPGASSPPAEPTGKGERILGWVGAYDIPAQRAALQAFLEGARLTHPQARVLSAFTQSLASAPAGHKAALDLMDRGARIVAHSAGNAGAGVMAAAQEGRRHSVGQEYSVTTERPEDSVLFFTFRRVDEALYRVLHKAASGDFPGNTLAAHSLADDMVGLAPTDHLPPAVLERLRQLRFEIQRGGITVPKVQKKTLCDCL